MKNINIKKNKSFFSVWIENFALALSVMYIIVIVSYAIMKGILNYFIFMIIGVVLLYVFLWGFKNFTKNEGVIRKTTINS